MLSKTQDAVGITDAFAFWGIKMRVPVAEAPISHAAEEMTALAGLRPAPEASQVSTGACTSVGGGVPGRLPSRQEVLQVLPQQP